MKPESIRTEWCEYSTLWEAVHVEKPENENEMTKLRYRVCG